MTNIDYFMWVLQELKRIKYNLSKTERGYDI